MILVGAADHAGYKTPYSALGTLVDVYANGHAISRHALGGTALIWSGASATAPQVSNLADWLLTVKPALSTTELKQRIIKSADNTVGDGEALLPNPKASMALLQQGQVAQGSHSQ